jgi:dihydrofolate reductase
MGTVNAGAAMSLDGFIADPSGEVGPLFDWYFNGDVEFPTAGGRWVFKTSEASARHLREVWTSAGALVVGRGEFDKTQAWGGLHPLGVPVFVLTHRPPAEWPFPETPPPEEVPFTFVTDGIESAIAQAQAVAGDKVVGLNPGSIAGQALNAGLLDEAWIELVPVWLGDGIRLFGDVVKPPVLFEDPRVIEGNAVTHLMYKLRRQA